MLKVLKLAGGVPSGKLKAPPKSCIPNRAKMRMKRKRRKRRERMDLMELNRDITRLRRDDQYLEHNISSKFFNIQSWSLIFKIFQTRSVMHITCQRNISSMEIL